MAKSHKKTVPVSLLTCECDCSYSGNPILCDPHLQAPGFLDELAQFHADWVKKWGNAEEFGPADTFIKWVSAFIGRWHAYCPVKEEGQ